MKNQKPNVLLICTDHLSHLMTGPGGNNKVMTPTLNQLAMSGTTFTNAYSACPSCVPARRGLMTGLSPKSHGDRIYNTALKMPDVPTMADCFTKAGYQAYAVGKLHVNPQRDRIGFMDVILEEQGRHIGNGADGRADDYELFLQEQGYAGQEYGAGMCHNDFITRTWHLPEYCHPINWAAREMCKTIRRRNAEKPGFWYLSFSSPHPPMTPLQSYMDMYRDIEPEEPTRAEWSRELDKLPIPLQERALAGSCLIDKAGPSAEEIKLARRAYYATITHIDHQIRLVIGTLREEGLLDNTIIAFTSDHGHMIGEHGMWCMKVMNEISVSIPLIIATGANIDPVGIGLKDERLAEICDIMPTLLDLAGIEIPDGVDGISLASEASRDYLYGETDEDEMAVRMVVKDGFKLIYYAAGNVFQLFNVKDDPRETVELSGNIEYNAIFEDLKLILIDNLYGSDLNFMQNGELKGLPHRDFDFTGQLGLLGQRGLRYM